MLVMKFVVYIINLVTNSIHDHILMYYILVQIFNYLYLHICIKIQTYQALLYEYY